MSWFDRQEKLYLESKGLWSEGIQLITAPQLGIGVEDVWTNKYIHSAYQKGIFRARQEMKKVGYNVPSIAESGGLGVALNQPMHIDRLGLVYSRTYEELKGINASMSSQISRVLAQGMAEGRNPRELAVLLASTVMGPVGGLGITDTLGRFIPAARRAEIMARTEVIRAHHVATIQEYRNWGLEGVQVQAEWATAGDDRVCDECASLEGKIFTLEEIEGMIPLHPQCRCIALPLDMTGKEKEGREEESSKLSDSFESILAKTDPLATPGEVLYGYQDYDYEPINNFLRYQNEPRMAEWKPELKELTEESKSLLMQKIKTIDMEMVPTTKEMLAFRGDGASISANLFEQIEDLKNLPRGFQLTDDMVISGVAPNGGTWESFFSEKLVGATFIEDGFLSTSKNLSVVKEKFLMGSGIGKYGGEAIVTLKIPKGIPAIDLDAFLPGTDEAEILLTRGLKLTVSKVQIGFTPRGNIYAPYFRIEVEVSR